MDNITILSGLTNGNRTDLFNNKVTNADAVLLLLSANGGKAKTRDLRQALRTWSNSSKSFGYLFQNYEPGWSTGYGFVGRTFEQATTEIDGPYPYNRRNFYYRTQRGTVAISAEGFRRLAELSF